MVPEIAKYPEADAEGPGPPPVKSGGCWKLFAVVLGTAYLSSNRDGEEKVTTSSSDEDTPIRTADVGQLLPPCTLMDPVGGRERGSMILEKGPDAYHTAPWTPIRPEGGVFWLRGTPRKSVPDVPGEVIL